MSDVNGNTKINNWYRFRRAQTKRSNFEGIVEESDFSDTAYNSTYVSDVQSLIVKSNLQQFFCQVFDTR